MGNYCSWKKESSPDGIQSVAFKVVIMTSGHTHTHSLRPLTRLLTHPETVNKIGAVVFVTEMCTCWHLINWPHCLNILRHLRGSRSGHYTSLPTLHQILEAWIKDLTWLAKQQHFLIYAQALWFSHSHHSAALWKEPFEYSDKTFKINPKCAHAEGNKTENFSEFFCHLWSVFGE